MRRLTLVHLDSSKSKAVLVEKVFFLTFCVKKQGAIQMTVSVPRLQINQMR